MTLTNVRTDLEFERLVKLALTSKYKIFTKYAAERYHNEICHMDFIDLLGGRLYRILVTKTLRGNMVQTLQIPIDCIGEHGIRQSDWETLHEKLIADDPT